MYSPDNPKPAKESFMTSEELFELNKQFFSEIPDRITYFHLPMILKHIHPFYKPHLTRARSLAEALYLHVTIDSDKGCWTKDNWQRYRTVWYQNRNTMAHRLSYQLIRGNIGDKFVCHYCDIPGCVMPYHLFLGTSSDNLEDYRLKKLYNLI